MFQSMLVLSDVLHSALFFCLRDYTAAKTKQVWAQTDLAHIADVCKAARLRFRNYITCEAQYDGGHRTKTNAHVRQSQEL